MRTKKYHFLSVFLLAITAAMSCEFIDDRLRDFADLQEPTETNGVERCELLAALDIEACEVPEDQIAIVVYNTNKPISGMNSDQPASSLNAFTHKWAEDQGTYGMESVPLNPYGDGNIWLGVLQLNLEDLSERDIIIYDDVYTIPHLIGGADAGDGTTNNYHLIPTAGYFSPCTGLTVNGEPLASHFAVPPDISAFSLPEGNYDIDTIPLYSGERLGRFGFIPPGDFFQTDFVIDFEDPDPQTYCTCTTTTFTYLNSGFPIGDSQPILDPTTLGINQACGSNF